jgi:NNP family nitrate/nitrite transporter-like MFS transporter
MNDLASAKASFREQAVIFGRKHNWIMCWLYLGTFGSFIGFSSGFGILIKSQFPEVDAVKYAFLGPLVGALLRPLGGWVSDKIGGARVTLTVFLAMIAGVLGVLHFLPQAGSAGSFPGFLACFLALFALTGIGNGSTFRMIPIIFLTRGRGKDAEANPTQASRESAAVLGFSGAIGAYGGFFIPKSFGSSIASTGHADAALWGFIAFYVTCVALTWWHYARAKAEVPC